MSIFNDPNKTYETETQRETYTHDERRVAEDLLTKVKAVASSIPQTMAELREYVSEHIEALGDKFKNLCGRVKARFAPAPKSPLARDLDQIVGILSAAAEGNAPAELKERSWLTTLWLRISNF